MSITNIQAVERLSEIDSVEALRYLISQLDVTGEGGITILYSRGVSRGIVNNLVSQGENIRIADTTEAEDFLDLDANPALEAKLRELFRNSDPNELGSAANRFLFGNAEYENGQRVPGTCQPNGVWDIVSRNFVEATTGEVCTLLDGVVPDANNVIYGK